MLGPVPRDAMPYSTLEAWIAGETHAFSLDAPAALNAAIDLVMTGLGERVELLGFGEALHGGEEILLFRNQLFQRLVEKHGYNTIAIESSFTKGRAVNEYVAGRGEDSYEALVDLGFGHAFGRLEANRELVEWMRRYNATLPGEKQLRFFGFDIPSGAVGFASPRNVLNFVLDYFTSVDPDGAQRRRERVEAFVGDDADWENPAALTDPSKSIGLSSAATSLRIETEDLLNELRRRGPELIAASNAFRYREALQYLAVARQLLNAHAAQARQTGYAELLGMRDVLMADTLAYIVASRHGSGKVLAFAHNSHLKRGQAEWPLGSEVIRWWPAGAHLSELLGDRYAVLASAVGVSPDNGIEQPEAGSLEALLTATPGPLRFLSTREGPSLSGAARLPVRARNAKNPTYFPLDAHSMTDFDWWLAFDTSVYNRGGPPLSDWTGDSAA